MILLTVLISQAGPVVLASEQSGGLSAGIETNAIALVDAALANDADAVQRRYGLLREQVERLHASVVEEKFDERRTREMTMVYSWLRLVKINIHNNSMLGAAIAANQLSGEIVRFAQSESRRNWDAHWLAYLGRELTLLLLEGAEDNADLLDSRRSDALNTWQRLRQEIISNFRNKPLVEEGDQLLQRMTSNRDEKQAIELGRQLTDFMGKVMRSSE